MSVSLVKSSSACPFDGADLSAPDAWTDGGECKACAARYAADQAEATAQVAPNGSGTCQHGNVIVTVVNGEVRDFECPECEGGDDFSVDYVTPLLDALDGGATGATEYVGEVPTSGYLVGLPERVITFDSLDAVDGQEVAYWARRNAAADIVASLGAWVNPDNGRVYFDACSHHAHRVDALTIAEERGEIAIWDIGAHREERADAPR